MNTCPAVATEAQTTAPTALGEGLEYLEVASGKLKLAVPDVNDPPESCARIDLAIMTVADRATFWIYHCIICDRPAKAASIDVRSAYPIGWFGQKLSHSLAFRQIAVILLGHEE
ncbi:hypothetical protein [Marivita sp. XM-24bin2]|jgi:hypothetical protein|uniref:hypothetical protein n=1 Tax=unclassified Marivita TaxID=2632480 RepID=UPI0025C47585|nr:hypothetical protein [Marivita sp. XM-24bin2]MCR9111378.1 hypothetical protein [Paracoccaceae bacterium]